MTARSVPSSLAPIIEELELRQPKLVTKAYLENLIAERNLELRPKDVSHRLQKQGWLLSLKTKDAWEFAPASRAGKPRLRGVPAGAPGKAGDGSRLLPLLPRQVALRDPGWDRCQPLRGMAGG